LARTLVNTRREKHMAQFQGKFQIRYNQLLVLCVYLLLLLFGCLLPREIERVSYLTVVLVAAFVAEPMYRFVRHTAFVLAIASFILAILFEKNLYSDIFLVVTCILILLYSVTSVIALLTRSGSITANEMLCLVNCYVLIGFLWAFVYVLLELIKPGSFGFANRGGLIFDAFIYHSFATITTLGYGGVMPQYDVAQRLCVIEAIGGQFYFAVVVAYLLNNLSHRRENVGSL